ncbi:MAG: MetQ/NlpA family ABC transporter substrate-binding protein, partial [Eubacteriales bacterium]|nr:MetQ/NlpA family ABC transporter substrate-binding protein [Eubacteriales bacterium]
MKKIISRILVAVLAVAVIFSLTACYGSAKKKISVAIPNDTTYEARALLLLEDLGYIKLKDGAGICATPLDIEYFG